jgi:ComF family protein
VCGACAADPPDFDAARAAIAYTPQSRALVLDLKRGGRRDGLALFGRWMAQAGGDLLSPDAVATPVPLHWTRLIERRFNQAAWLAEALARETGLGLKRDLLVRQKRRRSQGGLSAAARRRNVGGVFGLPPQRAGLVAGRTIILVDDVYTTGATVNACARALKKAGAAKVVVITLARVIRPTDLGV